MTVLTLIIQGKNPVIAYSAEEKETCCMQNKCCTLLFSGIHSMGELPGSIFGLFRRESVDFNLDAVVFSRTKSVLLSVFVLRQLMLGRLIKSPGQ